MRKKTVSFNIKTLKLPIIVLLIGLHIKSTSSAELFVRGISNQLGCDFNNNT